MEQPVAILEEQSSFTSYYFYTQFIEKVAQYYKNHRRGTPISFVLSQRSEFENFFKETYIDPIALPLLVSLGEQLKRYHNNQPLHIYLVNAPGANKSLDFLYQSDFFQLVGDEKVYGRLSGRNIFDFDNAYLGGFDGTKYRPTHKIRGYSLEEEELVETIREINSDEDKRDYLVDYYTYKVREHFSELLFENIISQESANQYILILSELITNGVHHSKSNVYALMFSNKFSTKFSISDNGIGFLESLENKNDTLYYTKREILNELKPLLTIELPQGIADSLLSIFEALFYSLNKERHGLFDLICKVVIDEKGYFRLHNNNAQIIVSMRMYDELQELYFIRKEILDVYTQSIYNRIHPAEYHQIRLKLLDQSKAALLSFAEQLFNSYSKDIQYSAIRLFPVKFKGVHIEVEIPNSNSSWS